MRTPQEKKHEPERDIMSNRNEPIFVPDGKNAIHDGIEHEPTGGKALMDPTDAAMLLLDHQSGLFQNVKDISITELRANTTALAKVAASACAGPARYYWTASR